MLLKTGKLGQHAGATNRDMLPFATLQYVKIFGNSCSGSLTEKRMSWLAPSVLKLGFQEIITEFFYIIFQNLMFDVGLLFGMLDLSSFDQSCHFVLQLSHRCPVTSVFEFSIESFHLKFGICPN